MSRICYKNQYEHVSGFFRLRLPIRFESGQHNKGHDMIMCMYVCSVTVNTMRCDVWVAPIHGNIIDFLLSSSSFTVSLNVTFFPVTLRLKKKPLQACSQHLSQLVSQ